MTKKIKIIVVGKVKENYLKKGIDEYLKRLRPFAKIDIIELKDEGVTAEKLKLQNYLSVNSFVLDEKGKEFSSQEFSDLIKKSDEELTFIIGGHDGIDNSLKKNSISLSRMTFVHEMTRLILLEQIYRAFMIINNRQYHK